MMVSAGEKFNDSDQAGEQLLGQWNLKIEENQSSAFPDHPFHFGNYFIPGGPLFFVQGEGYGGIVKAVILEWQIAGISPLE